MRDLFRVTVFIALIFACLMAAADDFPSNIIVEPRPVPNPSLMRPHVGVKMGVHVPKGDLHSAKEFGLDLGFQPYIPYSLGLEINHTRVRSTGGGEDVERSEILAKANYNFGGSIPLINRSFLGVGIGPVLRNGQNRFALAPIIGFDWPITEGEHRFVTMGANLKYAWDVGGPHDTFSASAVGKFWF